MDVALIVKEAIVSRSKSLRSGVVCELDTEKAYDHTNWVFLLSLESLDQILD